MIRESKFTANQFWMNLLWKKQQEGNSPTTRPYPAVANTNSPQYANLNHWWVFDQASGTTFHDLITNASINVLDQNSNPINAYVTDPTFTYGLRSPNLAPVSTIQARENPLTLPLICPTPTSPCTISFWMRITSGFTSVIFTEESNANTYIEITIDGDSNDPQLHVHLNDAANADQDIYSPAFPNISDGVHLFHIVSDGSNTLAGWNIYMDGVLYTGNKYGVASLGAFNWTGANRIFFADGTGSGEIDIYAEMRARPVALTPLQIAAEYDPATRWDLYA